MAQSNDSKPPAACAHRTVEYRNNETNGRVSLEWWECRDCQTIFERKVESGGMSDDTIIRLQAMQLIALRSETPTLRDRFAMAAPLQMGQFDPLRQDMPTWADRLRMNATARYEWADAMMEARKPK